MSLQDRSHKGRCDVIYIFTLSFQDTVVSQFPKFSTWRQIFIFNVFILNNKQKIDIYSENVD